MALKESATESESSQFPKTQIEHRRAEDFISRYANNSLLQGSAWDLKIIFGELDQSTGPNSVIQHTAITLPWNQVKTLIYFLQLQLASQESERGKVHIPKEVVAHIPKEPPKEIKDVNPKSWEAIYGLYQELLAENPELVPKPSK